MILKIARYIEGEDWWLLDDIRKVSKAQFTQPFDKNFEARDADIFILDYEEHLKSGPEADETKRPDDRSVIRLVCRTAAGEEFSVLFDTIAFLLNDGGKTIEVIVANYMQERV